MARHLVIDGDAASGRHRIPLPPDRLAQQPGLVVCPMGLLITSLPRHRPGGVLRRWEWEIVDALTDACQRHADRLTAFAWVYSDHRAPVPILAPKAEWLARWRFDHLAVELPVPAVMADAAD